MCVSTIESSSIFSNKVKHSRLRSAEEQLAALDSLKNTYSTRKFDIIDLNKYLFNTYFNMAFYILNIEYYMLNE